MARTRMGGAHNLTSIEQAIRKLVDKRFKEIVLGPNGRDGYARRLANQLTLSGEWPRSSWYSENMGAPHVPDYERLASGISFRMLENLLWPEGLAAASSSNLYLWASHKKLSLGHGNVPSANALFYHSDPIKAPAPHQRKTDVLSYAEYRRTDYPFLNHETWSIRSSINPATPADEQEYSELLDRWERIKPYSSGRLVYWEASDRKDRIWRAPSEIARGFEARIDKALKAYTGLSV